MSTESIDSWFNRFKAAWVTKNMQELAELFDADVEYWETPYRRLSGIDAVMSEWEGVKTQEDIVVDSEVVLSVENLSTVKWRLSYVLDGTKHVWAGLYIVGLNDSGVCTYFYQVGEAQS